MPGPERRFGGVFSRSVIPWTGEWPDLSPVTIVRLERWVAFPLRPGDVPPEHAEPGFLGRYEGVHGEGDAPDAAYLDLARRLAGR